MQVKALKPHGNANGAKFWKEKDETYSIPAEQAKPLIEAGLVEEVKDAAPVKAARKSSVKKAPVTSTDPAPVAVDTNAAGGNGAANS